MHPGSFLLGNPGAGFECSHEHGRGDRCISIHLAPELFADIAALAANSSEYRFALPMLPAAQRTMACVVGLQAIDRRCGSLEIEEAVAAITAEVVSRASEHAAIRTRTPARVERRIADIVRHMSETANDPHSLADLAAAAGLSRFHFLRTFRQVVGMSPHQYLLTLRMRRAATRLLETSQAVSAVAFDAGFNDLSTFNRRFRHLFGLTPLEFRACSRAFLEAPPSP